MPTLNRVALALVRRIKGFWDETRRPDQRVLQSCKPKGPRLGPGGDSGDEDKWLDFGFMWKAELIGFVEG